jgi:hypothetical protein
MFSQARETADLGAEHRAFAYAVELASGAVLGAADSGAVAYAMYQAAAEERPDWPLLLMKDGVVLARSA